jgi:hypothetical protein
LSILLVDEGDGIGNAGARGPVAIDLVRMIREPERNSANHATVVTEPEVAADQAGMPRQRGLRDGAEAERLGCQHEIADIGAAIDRTVNPKRLGGMNNGNMRGAKEVVILQCLLAIGGLVAARNAKRVV